MREKEIIVITALLSILAPFVTEIYSSLYHDFDKSPVELVFICAVVTLVLSIPTFLSAVILHSSTAVRFSAGMTIFYSCYRLFKTIYPGIAISWSVKISMTFVIMILLLYCARYLGEYYWKKGMRIVLLGIISWIFSTPLVALVQQGDGPKNQATLSVQRVLEHAPKAVVVLVLDETSPQFISTITKGLETSTHTLHIGISQKAGNDTINAIPSMLTQLRHDDITVCGSTRLCGENGFDMKKLRAMQPRTDVVGFYHPYCAIHDLRSCWRAGIEHFDAPTSQLKFFASVKARLPLINLLYDSNKIDNSLIYDNIRDSIANHALDAPFWSQNGGLLYIHQMLPHPMGTGDPHSLLAEYQGNIREAKKFVNILNARLQNNFHKDYAFIITTDHPLRTAMWCSSPVYGSPQCSKENSKEGDQVPFIVLAPKEMQVKLPVSNVGVFSSP